MNLTRAIGKIGYALANGLPGINISHYWRPKMEPPFMIWQEDEEASSLEADSHKQEQALGGSIDYFTLNEMDPKVDQIQTVLNSIDGFAWRLESVQYEDDTNLIHYEWRFEVI